jgi:intracellular sulfur oxidation DsrE/DsrF family protein
MRQKGTPRENAFEALRRGRAGTLEIARLQREGYAYIRP